MQSRVRGRIRVYSASIPDSSVYLILIFRELFYEQKSNQTNILGLQSVLCVLSTWKKTQDQCRFGFYELISVFSWEKSIENRAPLHDGCKKTILKHPEHWHKKWPKDLSYQTERVTCSQRQIQQQKSHS